MDNNNNTSDNQTIYFTQTGLDTWRAFCGRKTVATIREITEDRYEVIYSRTPWANKRNPLKVKRTVNGDLDRVQKNITARGWC